MEISTARKLWDQVRQTAFEIHEFHGHGHLEKIYENALGHRLRRLGHYLRQQAPILVFDEDGTQLGEYHADLLIDGGLIIELKTVRALAPEHDVQVLGYLKSARLQHPLLINFGSDRFQIKKYIWNANLERTRTIHNALSAPPPDL